MGQNTRFHFENHQFNEEMSQTLPKTSKLVLRLGENGLTIAPAEQCESLSDFPKNFSQFLLNSPLSGSEILIHRDFLRERFIEIRE